MAGLPRPCSLPAFPRSLVKAPLPSLTAKSRRSSTARIYLMGRSIMGKRRPNSIAYKHEPVRLNEGEQQMANLLFGDFDGLQVLAAKSHFVH